MRTSVARAALATLLTMLVARAAANGLEVPAQGTAGLARGGAFLVRADDATAMQYNPAQLVELTQPELLVELHTILWNSCVGRSGGYPFANDLNRFGAGADYIGESYARVCRSGPASLSPYVAFGMAIGKRWGFAIGLMTPVGSSGNNWGPKDHAIEGTTGEERPVPTRYHLLFTDSQFLDWTAAVGWRALPRLRFGLGLHVGMAFSHSATMVGPDSSQEAGYDIKSEFSVKDLFIPGIAATVHWVVSDAVEVSGGFKWFDDVRASGSADITTNYYASGMALPRHTIADTTHVEGFRIRVPQQTRVWLGARYASRRSPRTLPLLGRGDPMETERWDIEADIVYEHNSRFEQYTVGFPEGVTTLVSVYDDAGERVDTETMVGTRRVAPKRWQNTFTAHLGGDWNVLPSALALRAGLSYEDRGIDVSNLNIDFMPLRRYGLHAGVTWRIGRIDLVASYGHIFQETVVVAPEGSGTSNEGNLRQITSHGEGAVINAGKYTASWDIFSAGFKYRF